MDILNFRDLKIKRNTMRASPKLRLNLKFTLKFTALGKFASLQTSNFTYRIAADRSFCVR